MYDLLVKSTLHVIRNIIIIIMLALALYIFRETSITSQINNTNEVWLIAEPYTASLIAHFIIFCLTMIMVILMLSFLGG